MALAFSRDLQIIKRTVFFMGAIPFNHTDFPIRLDDYGKDILNFCKAFLTDDRENFVFGNRFFFHAVFKVTSFLKQKPWRSVKHFVHGVRFPRKPCEKILQAYDQQ